MILKTKIKQQLLNSPQFRKALADQRGTDTPNVVKLIKKDSELLTTIPVVELIKLHTGISAIEELFDFTIVKS